jgi:hypothetical protein
MAEAVVMSYYLEEIRMWLFSGSGVLGCGGSCHQGRAQLAEEGSAATAGVVHELEEAEIERQLVLRNCSTQGQRMKHCS